VEQRTFRPRVATPRHLLWLSQFGFLPSKKFKKKISLIALIL
jgi:hypothetical protein